MVRHTSFSILNRLNVCASITIAGAISLPLTKHTLLALTFVQLHTLSHGVRLLHQKTLGTLDFDVRKVPAHALLQSCLCARRHCSVQRGRTWTMACPSPACFGGRALHKEMSDGSDAAGERGCGVAALSPLARACAWSRTQSRHCCATSRPPRSRKS